MKKLLKCWEFFEVCGASLIFFLPSPRSVTFEHLARRDEQERAACIRQHNRDLYHQRGPTPQRPFTHTPICRNDERDRINIRDFNCTSVTLKH